MNKIGIVVFFAFVFTVFNSIAQNREPELWSVYTQDEDCRNWVDSVYNSLTLDEIVGQLFMKVVSPSNSERFVMQKLIEENHVGGLLFQKGDALEQAEVTNYCQSLAKVPLMITLDGEWGLSMRLENTIRFPRNMMLGAVADDSLIFAYGKEVGRQCREMGIHVNFAPVADVNSNPQNPVIGTRSFGENPKEVARKAIAYFKGLQSEGILAVGKHFPGHGDTSADSHKELPVVEHSKTRLDSVELFTFRKLIVEGIDGMMNGHLYVPAIDSTEKQPSCLSSKVVTDLLRDSLGFQGISFTDALVMKGVASSSNLCVRALLAGNDVLLDPENLENEMQQVKQAVEEGTITRLMLEEKVMRILTYKYVAGLNNYQPIRLPDLNKRLNTHRGEDLNNDLNSEAMTLLKNEKEIIPLKELGKYKVGAISLGESGQTVFQNHLQEYCNVHYLSFNQNIQKKEEIAVNKTFRNQKRMVIAIHSTRIKENDFLVSLCQKHQVVLVFFVSPYSMSNFKRSIAASYGVIMAYENSNNAQMAAAEAVFGGIEINGHLPVSVSGLFRAGEGLTLSKSRLSYLTTTRMNLNYTVLDKVEKVVQVGINEKAFPGCQVVAVKDGVVIYNRAFGYFDYAGTHPVLTSDVYDLASLTKTTATLPAIMKLYDEKKIALTDKVGKYLSFLKSTDKAAITLSDLLYHQSGLVSFIPFYQSLYDKESYNGPLFKNERDAVYRIPFDQTTYANQDAAFYSGMVSESRKPHYTTEVAEGFYLHDSFRDSIQREIANSTLRTKGKYVYSDLNFMLLKEVAETISHQPLNEYVDSVLFRPLGADNTCYLPLKRIPKTSIAPTVDDLFFRKQLLVGYPHDEIAAVMGGVSGNAGLFSSAGDVAKYLQMLLNCGEYGGERILTAKTVDLFTKSKSKVSRRGLGFDKSVAGSENSSPVCKVASQTSDVYGHTGFTGTCYWVDPHQKLIYILFTNRVYPNRDNGLLSSMSIRARIHELIYQAVGIQIDPKEYDD